MADYLKKLITVYIRQGRRTEALEHLIKIKGFSKDQANNYIKIIESLVHLEPNDD